jgi:hypothetical protein
MGYAMGQDNGNCNGDGLFGGGAGGWLGILLLIALLGGGLGFGGFGGFGGGAGLQGMATRADINEGFALNNITSGITSIQQGICDATYALTNAINTGFNSTQMGMMQGFNGVERGFCDLSHQLSDCCCENRQAIAQVRYDMANQTRDIIEGQNANTRAILDFLTTDKINTLQAENQALKFAASQAQQNAFITANQDAQTAELIRRLGRDCPIPAYVVPNPNCCYGNPVGVSYGAGFGGGGCGCGCG